MFHGKLDGETSPRIVCAVTAPELDPFARGFLFGLLVGEGHFGGDGRQPQVTLRMHVRHEQLFRWLQRVLPEGRLYGPYHHGGRSYYQWMVRGRPLRERLWPMLTEHLAEFDDHIRARLTAMATRYGLPLPDDAVAQGSSETP